jgi:hypothetical protein
MIFYIFEKFSTKMLQAITAFGNNFLGSLRDKPGSHSMKKWLCILIGLVYAYTSVKHTNHDNLAAVLAVHAGLITALLGIHAYYKNKTNPNDPPPADSQQQG